MVSMHLEKPVCTPPSCYKILPNAAFETVPMFVWLTMALPFFIFQGNHHHFLFLCSSPPGNIWCDVFSCVPAGCVSSSLFLFASALKVKITNILLKLIWSQECIYKWWKRGEKKRREKKKKERKRQKDAGMKNGCEKQNAKHPKKITNPSPKVKAITEGLSFSLSGVQPATQYTAVQAVIRHLTHHHSTSCFRFSTCTRSSSSTTELECASVRFSSSSEDDDITTLPERPPPSTSEVLGLMCVRKAGFSLRRLPSYWPGDLLTPQTAAPLWLAEAFEWADWW